MTTGGKSQGVYVVTQAEVDSGKFRVAPGKAIKVSGLASSTRGVMGGPSIPVYAISDPSARGVEGGEPIPVSNLTATTRPVEHNLAIPVYVVEDDGQFAAPVEPPTDFWNFLFAFYQLEEASGTRVDSRNDYDVAVVATDPGQAAGKFSNAASFNQTGFLQSVDSDWQNWGSFSGAAWFYPTAADTRQLMGVYLSGTSGNLRSWGFQTNTSALRFGIYRSTDGNTSIISTANAYSLNVWNFGAFRFNHTTRQQSVRLNGGSWASSIATAGMKLGAYPFNLGTFVNQVSSFGWTGRIDHTGIWKDYLLTDDDYDFLRNNGAGRTWAEIQEYGNAP